MPTIPKLRTLTNSSRDIINAIRNSATTNYRDFVPLATEGAESIREIGNVIMDFPALQNEFLSALVNRIGRVVIQSREYSSPWKMFKKGMLEYGETIETIFCNIAQPFTFDPAVAETELYKRELPDVKSFFTVINYKKFYKVTISEEQLRQAFLSWDGINDLIGRIVDTLYSGEAYDEFLAMKYLLARHIVDGHLYPVTVPTLSPENARTVTSIIKSTSNKLTFLTDKYNPAGVKTNSDRSKQYIICNADWDAVMDVDVLAVSFNESRADFIGRRILVDGFGDLDQERLQLLFGNNEDYRPITAEEQLALKEIPAVMLDEDWFMVYDNLQKFTSKYNDQGLYWNYFYHTWKTFAMSPFAQGIVFVPGTPSVNGVTVSPSEITAPAGTSFTVTATVDTEYYANKAVTWASSNSSVTVDRAGTVTIGDSVADGTVVTITATSVYDATKSATCTLTVGSGGGGSVTVTASPQTADVSMDSSETTKTATITLSGANIYAVTENNIEVTGYGQATAPEVVHSIIGNTLTIAANRESTAIEGSVSGNLVVTGVDEHGGVGSVTITVSGTFLTGTVGS